ncbi:MAG TPA: hypothetical protein VF432_18105 [Thermoanaerobaculia bacterium]
MHLIDTATNTVSSTLVAGGAVRDVTFALFTAPPAPTSKNQCKNGGWMNFTNPSFKSQA